MKARSFIFEFVDLMPARREDGKLYISIKYRTAVHNCFCGCGMKVVTPIRPTGWRLTYDGDAVSLSPSIGNWSFPCRSHYWLRDNKALPAGSMDDEKIDAGRRRDQAARDRHFGEMERPKPVSDTPASPSKRTLWQRIVGRFS